MLVVVIISAIAALIVQRLTTSIDNARVVVEQSCVDTVRRGIRRANLLNGAWPATLDSAAVGASSPANPFFDAVLGGVGDTTGNWTKSSATTYIGPNEGVYTYDPLTGTFSP